MPYPSFYDQVTPIRVYDPLSEFLGASEEGVVEYTYLDCVKLAGHSCPTVAGAFLMARIGLKALYGAELPVRGEIEVFITEPITQGVAGVVGNILSFITGANGDGGFKGVGGHFGRNGLLHYGVAIEGEVMLRRTDSGVSVTLTYDPSSIDSDPRMKSLMGIALSGTATEEQKRLFGELWQQRVAQILLEKSLHTTIITHQ
jgi:hypothetical protein